MSTLIILASGAGSTFESIVNAAQAGQLPNTNLKLITSRPGTGAEQIARNFGIDVVVISPQSFSSGQEWDRAVAQQIQAWRPDLVALAGYTLKLGPTALNSAGGRVINTHPALLPKYGGKGMYGRRVHEAVVKNSEKETGITVHWVTEEYDAGPIVAQERVLVLPDDTPGSLAERLKAIERPFYLGVIKRLLNHSAVEKFE